MASLELIAQSYSNGLEVEDNNNVVEGGYGKGEAGFGGIVEVEGVKLAEGYGLRKRKAPEEPADENGTRKMGAGRSRSRRGGGSSERKIGGLDLDQDLKAEVPAPSSSSGKVSDGRRHWKTATVTGPEVKVDVDLDQIWPFHRCRIVLQTEGGIDGGEGEAAKPGAGGGEKLRRGWAVMEAEDRRHIFYDVVTSSELKLMSEQLRERKEAEPGFMTDVPPLGGVVNGGQQLNGRPRQEPTKSPPEKHIVPRKQVKSDPCIGPSQPYLETTDAAEQNVDDNHSQNADSPINNLNDVDIEETIAQPPEPEGNWSLCKVCGERFSCTYDLSRHTRKEHRKRKQSEPEEEVSQVAGSSTTESVAIIPVEEPPHPSTSATVREDVDDQRKLEEPTPPSILERLLRQKSPQSTTEETGIRSIRTIPPAPEQAPLAATDMTVTVSSQDDLMEMEIDLPPVLECQVPYGPHPSRPSGKEGEGIDISESATTSTSAIEQEEQGDPAQMELTMPELELQVHVDADQSDAEKLDEDEEMECPQPQPPQVDVEERESVHPALGSSLKSKEIEGEKVTRPTRSSTRVSQSKAQIDGTPVTSNTGPASHHRVVTRLSSGLKQKNVRKADLAIAKKILMQTAAKLRHSVRIPPTAKSGPVTTVTRAGNRFCTICKYTFSTPHNLKKHQQRLHSEGALPQRVRNVSHVISNKASSHSKSGSTTTVTRPGNRFCTICKYTFSTPYNLKKHRRRLHSAGARALPQQVRNASSNMAPVTSHTAASNSAPSSFKCPVCPAQFTQESNLKKHMVLLHASDRKRPWKCTICRKAKFSTKWGLIKHQSQNHPGEGPTTGTKDEPRTKILMKKSSPAVKKEGPKRPIPPPPPPRRNKPQRQSDTNGKAVRDRHAASGQVRIHEPKFQLTTPPQAGTVEAKFQAAAVRHFASKRDINGTYGTRSNNSKNEKSDKGRGPEGTGVTTVTVSSKNASKMATRSSRTGGMSSTDIAATLTSSVPVTSIVHSESTFQSTPPPHSRASEKPYECGLCLQRFSREATLKRHIPTAHANDDQIPWKEYPGAD